MDFKTETKPLTELHQVWMLYDHERTATRELRKEVEQLNAMVERQKQQLEDYAHTNIADRQEIDRLRKELNKLVDN